MAPSLGKGTKKATKSIEISTPVELAQKMTAMVLALKKHVEENCDYVGDAFAEEARRIHRGEADARPIRGQSSAEEFLSLLEEGIEVLPLPPLDEDMH